MKFPPAENKKDDCDGDPRPLSDRVEVEAQHGSVRLRLSAAARSFLRHWLSTLTCSAPFAVTYLQPRATVQANLCVKYNRRWKEADHSHKDNAIHN